MLERDIEKYLVAQCARRDILLDKFTSPNGRAVPDRILTYAGRVIFLELKATGKKPSPAQERDHYRRAQHGAEVRWTDSKEGVAIVIACLRGGMAVPTYAGSFQVDEDLLGNHDGE